MRRLWTWITGDWLNKGVALVLAVILFWIVDAKISDRATFTFTVRFGPLDRDVTENTLFLTVPPAFAGVLEPAPGLLGDRLEAVFRGPRGVIQELRGRRPLLAVYTLRQTPPGAEPELAVDIPEETIQFLGVDRSQVTVTLPDIRVRLLRLTTVPVAVAVETQGFLVPGGYRLGQPQPERSTVEVTCPVRYATFTTITFAALSERERRRLSPTDNRRLFRARRPPGLPPGVPFTVRPPEQEVTLPLVPIHETLDLEVPVVLLLPADEALKRRRFRVHKARETFTFVGPPHLLKRLKTLENTRAEVRAVVDLTGLTAEEWKALLEGGKSFRPFFLYPEEVGQTAVQCQQPKHIWVEVVPPGTD